MSKAKLLSYSDITKHVKLESYFCDKEGIEIAYNFLDEEHTIIGGPEVAADLLKTVGEIDNYFLTETDVRVKIEGIHTSWNAFVTSYDLSQLDAIRIAAMVEDKKQIQSWKTEMASVDQLINQIVRA